MKAIILAGGLGTRLRGRISDLPKPMAPVCGRPFLAHVLEKLVRGRVQELILSVGYKSHIIREYFGMEFNGVPVRYICEEEPLGTGGAIAYAMSTLGMDSSPVLVVNGDSWVDLDYIDFVSWYHRKQIDVAMVLSRVPNRSRYGAVKVEDGFITGFYEKGLHEGGLINSGTYIFNSHVFAKYELPRRFSLEKDFIEKYLNELKPFAYVCQGQFVDIGIPEDLDVAEIVLDRQMNPIEYPY